MDSSDRDEIVHDFAPFIRIYKNGRIERLMGNSIVPPSYPDSDPDTGVTSKDVVIFPDSGVSARIYLPKLSHPNQKIPVLVYIHGGGFCIETAFSPTYHYYLNSLVEAAGVLAVSVDYRRVPEHPLPVAYDDSWAAIQWVVSHAAAGDGVAKEAWLTEHGDFSRLFVGGDSAGANIVHHVAMRSNNGCDIGHGVKVDGAVLIHPFFWGSVAIGNEPKDALVHEKVGRIWRFACPSTVGLDDPLINPTAAGAPSMAGLGCKRVIVFVAEKDMLKDRGWDYCQTLERSGWKGEVEIMECQGEDHVFHLVKPRCENAGVMKDRLVSFLKAQSPL